MRLLLYRPVTSFTGVVVLRTHRGTDWYPSKKLKGLQEVLRTRMSLLYGFDRFFYLSSSKDESCRAFWIFTSSPRRGAPCTTSARQNILTESHTATSTDLGGRKTPGGVGGWGSRSSGPGGEVPAIEFENRVGGRSPLFDRSNFLGTDRPRGRRDSGWRLHPVPRLSTGRRDGQGRDIVSRGCSVARPAVPP